MTPNVGRPERFEGHLFPQIIPEPDDAKPGAPAPWSTLSDAMRTNLTLDIVEERLAAAHRLLASSSPPEEPDDLSIVADGGPAAISYRSAVLVALFEEAGETNLVLTRRSYSMRSHRGEIALPGGRSEGSETPIQTALREANEEIGLDPSLVKPLAWLSPIASFVARSSIWPVVATLPRHPDFVIDPSEVDRAFSVALRDLVADGAFVEERWPRPMLRPGGDDDGYFPFHFYKVPGDIIWGATARMLTELLCLVTGAPWPS